ncbi:MAG TPA: 3-oxoacyl-[acyl-carrier-protein] reductase [Candidatus Dormibacteraeota bacterium]|nr:3-oxoacyl-[acyl-carrier-protein] reductase [Candidatus Dormibacteraeota bacterium]
MSDRMLDGQVALVTGASRGIGRATAIALAEQGASIAIGCTAKTDAAEEAAAAVRNAGVQCVLIPADLVDTAAARGVVERTLAELGGIDIVVNNAGITRDNLALRMSDDDWNAVIAVDLTAAFHVCRAALKPMLRKRYGRIVNVSSVSGVIGNAGQANYAAAKAGLVGLTKSLAREVATRDITVNAVAPGFIESDMTAALPEQARAAAVAAVPMGRMGTVQEVAACIVFLASPQAAYVTGHVLHVDGGLGA